MDTKNRILSGRIGLAWVLLLSLAPAAAMAEEYYLRAEPFDKTVLDSGGPTMVPMWGYALCDGTGGVVDGGSCGAPTSPGPTLEVTEGSDLTVYVENLLPASLVNVTNETSVLIPALPKALAPVRFTGTGDPAKDGRIYSFDAVTTNTATGTYVWTAPTPGTYLYHSGTHPQVQVQMGLYGAVIVRAAINPDCPEGPCAYSDVPYDEEVVAIFSEIDPMLHAAVASDAYGTAGGPTSTEYYQPRYFLINGESFPSPSLDPIFVASLNHTILIRAVNAGIEDHAPMLNGGQVELVAEDANRLPTKRSQHSLYLPAGKSMDLLYAADMITELTLFDRRLRTVNNTGANGGMFARFDVVNDPPVADAGPDQNLVLGNTANLDGSGSFDTNGDPLTYAWSITSVPGGSVITDADLSDAMAVNPSFTPDIGGDYVVQLIVNDGSVDSAPDFVTITVGPNLPPTADAGPDQMVAKGTPVQLDGSNSSDPNLDPLTYAWSFVSVPVGSTVTDGSLSDATAVDPMFTTDLAGDYVLQLIVNDGSSPSPADMVTITATNTVPVADAGPDQTVTEGDSVTLDGSGSSDADGDGLTYAWSFVSVPVTSAVTDASLSDPTAIGPMFTTDVVGDYVLQLIVNDGTDPSLADTVTITAEVLVLNTPPVANAGPDDTVTKGTLVQLDGSGSSDTEGSPLTYSWMLMSIPSGSAAMLSDPTAVNPTFTADLAGTYVAELIVHDGTDPSAPDTVTITATNTIPVANANGDMNVFVSNVVQLDGSASSDADGDPLTYAWSFTSVPVGSAVTNGSLSDATAANPTFVPDVEGVYVAQLIVNDGTADSAPDTSTITAAVGGGATGPFEQTGGILSMEAEHFATNTGASGVEPWQVLDPSAGASAAMAVKAAGGAQTYTAGAGPLLTYDVQLNAGVQRVWIRYRAFNFQSDSVFVQLDDGTILNQNVTVRTGAWAWADGAMTALTVPTTGVHTLKLFRREGAIEIDKIVMTADTAYNPAAINGGLGPDESPRVGGGGNSPPTSNAGPDQNVKTGNVVQLDGSGSADTDGDPLTYSWQLSTRPAGSAAVLSNNSIVNPTFTADLAGTYVAQLIVNDGMVNGLVDMVTITAAPNTPPVANAGLDATVPKGVLAQLNGSGSSDADGDPITYAWSFNSVPGGSAVNNGSLSSATAIQPTFTPDVAGPYVVQLVVNDGLVDSPADTVTITAENTAPVANAGPDQNVAPSDLVQLDGTGSSDANGDSLTYVWSFTSVPGGSAVTIGSLSDATVANPSFTVDVEGDYVLQLIVNDGTVPSAPDSVTITAAVGGGTGPFQQTGGILSMEAEHFAGNVGASGVGAWLVLDPSAGASAAIAVKAAAGAQTYTAGAGPLLTFDVQLDAGVQRIWIRYRAFNFQSDSVFVQLDNGPILNQAVTVRTGAWAWADGASTALTVPTTGVHTVKLYRREGDLEIDKIVITPDTAYNPAAINGGLGPDESPRL